MTNTKRHPAVIDLLGGTHAPRRRRGHGPNSHCTHVSDSAEASTQEGSRSSRLHYIAALIVVVALLGWFVLRLLSGSDESAQERIADETGTSETAPTLDITPPAPAAAETDPTACRTDPGDQKSGPGVIAAFEHAYYVTRSGTAVHSPPPTPPCQRRRRSNPESTPSQQEPPTACASHRSRPGPTPSLSPKWVPASRPHSSPQTITAKELDGRWFVDSIS